MILESVCYHLTRPFLYFLSSFICSYLTTTDEADKYLLKAFHFGVQGPIYLCLVIFFWPLYILGQLTWIFICQLFVKPDFTLLNFSEDSATNSSAGKNESVSKEEFTFGCANLLLGMNVTGKFQNMPDVYKRMNEIISSLEEYSEKSLSNVDILDGNAPLETKRDSCIKSQWPDLDFFLFQEVWDRYFVGKVVDKLKGRFPYFVCNISRDCLWNNLCSGSSGLLVASKYPIVEAKFHPFKNKKRNWQAFISYGVIMVKVDLDSTNQDSGIQKRIGFMACLHAMAYQEKENLIEEALNEVQTIFGQFREDNTNVESESVAFAVISGDFNFDNMSPGDVLNQKHPLFQSYRDICMAAPGLDKDWSIGTEHRQLRIYDEEMSTPEKFKKILMDDTRRRHYIIDADVEEHNFDLMVCPPKPNAKGEILATATGGRRRIDRIIFDETKSRAKGFAFVSRLAGQTDHVPIAITLDCGT